MRRWVVAILMIHAAACEQRYGTYLTVDGDSAAIGFDSVELYFGSQLELSMLQTPTRAGTGKMFKRRFDKADLVPVDAHADGTLSRETTFYLPVDDANQKLGDYVLAVGYVAREPKGIGELLGFKVEDSVVYTFDVELEPYQPADVDRWGESPGTCIAWTKHREGDALFTNSTYAVVLDDDHDCDGISASADCDDAAYCAPGAVCGPALTCGSGQSCSLGCGSDALTCTPKLCLYAGFCAADCQLASIDSRHACGIALPDDLIAVKLHTIADRVCTPTFKFKPYELACKDAKLEFAEVKTNDTTTFTVTDDGTNCIVTVAAASGVPLQTQHLMVISFQGPDPATRWSFRLAVDPSPTEVCDNAFVPEPVTIGAPADCK